MSDAADLYSGVQRVLIVQLSAIGDVLRAGSVVATIKRLHPQMRVGMVVFSDYADVVAGIPGLTYRHVFPNLTLKKALNEAAGEAELLRAIYDHEFLPIEEIQMRKYDVAFNFHYSTISAYLTTLSGAPKAVGMAAEANGNIDVFGKDAFALYDDLKSPERMTRSREHLAVRYHRICGLPEEDVRLSYEIPDGTPNLLPSNVGRPAIAIHVGAGWKEKCWPADRWKTLIARIGRELNGTVVLVGTAVERDRNFSGVLDGASGVPVVDMCGLPFVQSARVIESCDLFVGADSGPMHLASALGVPVVALFGPTSAAESYPLVGRNAVIKSARLGTIDPGDVMFAVRTIIGGKKSLFGSGKILPEQSGVLLYENQSSPQTCPNDRRSGVGRGEDTELAQRVVRV